MLETEISAGPDKGKAEVATTVVGHDAGHGDAEAFVVSDSRLEEGNGVIGCLTEPDLGKGYPGMIVDADMDELPAICLPVWRCRRNVSITAHVAATVVSLR